MQATISKIRENLIYTLPILTCFDAYCLTTIDTMPLTLSFICACFILILSLFEKTINLKKVVLLFGLLCLCLFNGFFSKIDVSATLLYIFYFATFLLCVHNFNQKKCLKFFRVFLGVIHVFSIIGLLQMASNFTAIPRLEIQINGHMVQGYNTYNLVYIGNLVIARSHGLYLEPSTMSQYCVLGIVLAVYLYKYKVFTKSKLICSLILNFIALVTTISGTGLVMFFILFAYYLLKKRYKKKDIYILCFLLGMGLLMLINIPDNLKKYIFDRLSEVNDPTLSGGMRFTYPFRIMFQTYGVYPLGIGPGNEGLAISEFCPEMFQRQVTVASGYAKMGIELGVFGLALLIYCIHKCKNERFKYFFVFIVMMNFMGGCLLNTYFWGLMILFNFEKNSTYKTTSPCYVRKKVKSI